MLAAVAAALFLKYRLCSCNTLYLNAGSLGSCLVYEILNLKQQSMLYLNAGSCGGCFVPEILHLTQQSILYLNAGSCGGCFVYEMHEFEAAIHSVPECWQL
jgi:hypothetical protein